MSKQIGQIIIVVLIVVVMFGLFKKFFGGADNGQLSSLIKNGAYLIDVRTPAEFAAGSVKGAVNIPLDSLPAKWQKLKGKQNIVVFCQSGGRSTQAKRLLEANGINNVTNGGGWQAVQKAMDDKR